MKFVDIKKSYPYSLLLLSFVLLKLFYIESDIDSLKFILSPVDGLISIITGTSSQYSYNGYLNVDLNILINKSCSGFNYLLILLVTITIRVFKDIKNNKYRLISFPLILLLSYLLTIIINTSRILLSLNTPKFEVLSFFSRDSLHKIEGIFIYISYLILVYLVLDKIIIKRIKKYEKCN